MASFNPNSEIHHRRHGRLDRVGRGPAIVVLDDAKNQAYGSLKEVRLLLGLNLAEPLAFALFLIGDEYLLGALRLRQHRSLYSRICLPLQPDPLDRDASRTIKSVHSELTGEACGCADFTAVVHQFSDTDGFATSCISIGGSGKDVDILPMEAPAGCWRGATLG